MEDRASNGRVTHSILTAKERLYEDGRFNTDADYCEIYGHDLMTGAVIEPLEYRAQNPDESYPFWLTTGRIVYH